MGASVQSATGSRDVRIRAVVMLGTPCSEVVKRVLATHSIRQFPLHSPAVRIRVPSHFNWTLLILLVSLLRHLLNSTVRVYTILISSVD
jgi:hypothetical protein